MTEIIVRLSDNADTSFLKRAIENMRGVFSASIRESNENETALERNDWLERLHRLKQEINPDVIDMNDERTRYIMSK